jgi:hypothetical protein
LRTQTISVNEHRQKPIAIIACFFAGDLLSDFRPLHLVVLVAQVTIRPPEKLQIRFDQFCVLEQFIFALKKYISFCQGDELVAGRQLRLFCQFELRVVESELAIEELGQLPSVQFEHRFQDQVDSGHFGLVILATHACEFNHRLKTVHQ